MRENRQRYEEDEIDLKELFKTLMNNKKIIIFLTTIVTLVSVVYVFLKTPIYEVRALVEIGNYKLDNNKVLLDNNSQLVKKLEVLFIDMYKNVENKSAEITSISIAKNQNTFIEIKADGISNDSAVEEVQKVVEYIRESHQEILNDVKQRREFEIKNIDTKILNINSSELVLLDDKIKLLEDTLKNYENELTDINKNIKYLEKINPTLAALNLTQRASILDNIYYMKVSLIDLKNEKDTRKTTKVNGLIEQKNILESMLLPYNYKNSEIVGEILTSKQPIKPKKKLIVTVAFVTGFILSIFLVFFMEFIKGFKKEDEGEVLN